MKKQPWLIPTVGGLVSILLQGCLSASYYQTPVLRGHQVLTPNFSAIEDSANYDIRIVTGHTATLWVEGDNFSYQQFSPTVSDGRLYLPPINVQGPFHMKPPMTVTVCLPALTNLIQTGRGDVSGAQIQSSGLSIIHYGKSALSLQGKAIALTSLKAGQRSRNLLEGIEAPVMNVLASETSQVTLNNVRSPAINITALHRSQIRIAGSQVGLKQLIDHSGSAVTIQGVTPVGSKMFVTGDGPVSVEGVIALQALKITGRSDVTLHKVVGDTSLINMSGSGKVELNGQWRVRQIYHGGKGTLALNWVETPDVSITMTRGGRLFITGRATRFSADVSGDSVMDARYINMQRAYIKTHQSSLAKIGPGMYLNTMAYDGSNIYYYGKHRYITKYMSEAGAVLPMQ